MRKLLVVLAVAAAALLPVSAWADSHVHVGVVAPHVHGWYGPRAGAYWGPGWGWGWGWGWGPAWNGYYGRYDTMGEVKLDTKVKDAQVFVNGGYLGTTGENKTIWLRPGGYKIEIKEAGHEPFNASVYVTIGKTLHLKPAL